MALLGYLTWDLDPEIFSIGAFALRWYGICFAAGFLIGFSIMKWVFQQEGKAEKDLDAMCVWLVVGTILGARLGHCLLYEFTYYMDNPIEILKVWKGGLASHGGTVGVFLALWLYSKSRDDQPYGWVIDRVAIPAALGSCLIRLGNFFNSEIVGTPTEVPWAVIFKRIDDLPRHPAQLYESLGYLLTFLLMLFLYRRRKAAMPYGFLTGWFLICIFTTRIIVEFFKVRQAAFAADWALSWGQILSIPFLLAGAGLVWYSHRKGTPAVPSG
ncbi:MAG: prolipoprotein diacylglyceryl transferase [Planctomycetota bacterium]|jgi:prolipoprotein diacylglyceryl transferase